jgi:hypothetical protein
MENQTNPTPGDNATLRIVIAELRAIADETDRVSDGSHPQWTAAYRAAALDVAKRLPPVPYRCQHHIACSGGRHSVACEEWNLEARITHAETAAPTGDRYRLAWLSARRRAEYLRGVVRDDIGGLWE